MTPLGASAVLELMQEARSRWTLTGLLSAWGADPVTIREAFPATGFDSTRDRIGCSWHRRINQRKYGLAAATLAKPRIRVLPIYAGRPLNLTGVPS